MKYLFSLFILLFFLCGLSIAASAQEKPAELKDRKILTAIYREFDEGIRNREIKVFEKYLGENYEIIKGKGIISRKEFISGMKGIYENTLEINESTSKIEKITVNGSNFILEVSSLIKGKGKLEDGEIMSFEMINKSTDIWKKTDGSWKKISQTNHDGDFFINGAPIIVI